MMATVAAVVEEPLPAGQAMDSFDMLPVLLGESGDEAPVRDHILMQADREDIFWAYREGDWKLAMDVNFAATDLYNLANDLAEANNLINDPVQAVRAAEMHDRFLLRRGSDRTAPEPVQP